MTTADTNEILYTEGSIELVGFQNSTFSSSINQTPRLNALPSIKNDEIRSSMDEEFFSLTCLALKINLVEEKKLSENLTTNCSGENYEAINMISEEELFELC